jgi:cytochrome c553
MSRLQPDLLLPHGARVRQSKTTGCWRPSAWAATSGKGGFDRLNGETAAEIAEELAEMRDSSKELDIMHMQARGYTDDQIRRIAGWFAAYAPGSGTSPRSEDSDDSDTRQKSKSSKSVRGKTVSATKPLARRPVTTKLVTKKPTVRKSS